uniref:AA_permease_C domain-containing protein n=1 Tax=Angiostrongylus cantonensis TaxID=6313 RepID=A0A158P889_ANGCA
MRFWTLREKVFRQKNISHGNLETQLRRCLTTTDITLLGIGHMIGAGIYVLTGSVVRNIAGPSIVLSFLLAGIASLLSALCYAEFGARFPKAGSAYTYAYVGVGELWAFIIGWNIILEHMLGAAAVARSWSGYLDSLLGNVIFNTTIERIGRIEKSSFFGDYPDVVAFILIVVVAIFVALGSKASTNFNSMFTVVNMIVIVIVVGYGITFADFSLWRGVDDEGRSRFFPYGVNGMLAGAASCFFAYIGFDGLATAGEEAKSPARSIPIATFASMTVVTLAYILMSASLTLMIPYYEVHPTAAFSDAFAHKGAMVAKIAVSVGALCGMMTSLVGGMFALPRCVFAMAEDGLLFNSLAVVNGKTQVPINAVLVFASITAIIALLFDIETLVEFLSIGTLLAYSIVSACVIILRYQPARNAEDGTFDNGGKLKLSFPGSSFLESFDPGHAIHYGVVMMVIGFGGFGLCLSSELLKMTTRTPHIQVPLVPLVPALGLLINTSMMLHLAPITWLRLVFWMTIGMSIYFGYGIHNSREAFQSSADARFSKSSTYESVVSTSTYDS